MKIWIALSLLIFTSAALAQSLAPLAVPPQHVRKHHEKEHQEWVARFNEIITHPQDTDKTAWEWYAFTDDTGWVVGGYNWAVVKWNEGYHATALDYFKWLSKHCEDPDGTREPDVCRLSKLALALK